MIFARFLKICVRRLKSLDSRERTLEITGIGICTALFVGGISTSFFHDYIKVTGLWLPVCVIIAGMNGAKQEPCDRKIRGDGNGVFDHYIADSHL